jgi:hypothetical protein
MGEVRKTDRRYVRVFDDIENVRTAIRMINTGYSYRSIGAALGCDRTSVMAFHKRYVKKEFQLEKLREFVARQRNEKRDDLFEGKPRPVYVPPKKEEPVIEKINEGKTSYKDYLKAEEARKKSMRMTEIRNSRLIIPKTNDLTSDTEGSIME